MTAEGLPEIRDRIHRKSDEYFTFAYRRRDLKKWRMFYGATDALLDAGTAAAGYSRAITHDPNVNLLACYGFLQALYVQQDAVITLSKSVGLEWYPCMDARLCEIRDIRNRLTGHPSLAGDKGKSARPSSGIIAYQEITEHEFSGYVYYADGVETIRVEPAHILRENEERLAIQMLAIEKKMDEEERRFRADQSTKSIGACFGVNFEYLKDRLRCALTDDARVAQAKLHAKLVREIMTKLQAELATRGFESEATSYFLGIIFTGLKLIDQILEAGSSSPDAQNELDLICDGLEKSLSELIEIIHGIDTKLSAPII